ncbi:MAG: xanthine dehydrogenase accessory factor [Pseudonocardiales bacterium]|nr:xanthine dehydrogenase accessory factor [Pseudonocardiales bacterium]
MYEIALSVAACLGAGTRVDVAWAVETHGFSSRDAAEALAITPGGGRVGSVLSGSLNDQLADLAGEGVTGRLVEVRASDVDALVAGLSCGGDARCLLVSAADLPGGLWERLRDREPVCLVTRLDGDQAIDTAMFTPETIAEADEDVSRLFNRGVSDTVVAADRVVTVLWPVPTLVIIGAGAIAEALAAAAALLGWHTRAITDVTEATGTIAGLAVLDKVVVLSHDEELGGRALAAALSARPGYIGALGSRRTQQARADWLAYRGIVELDRIYGPAGLDIGANTPAEIAVSVIAEAMAVKSGSNPRSLRERAGSIH